MSDDAFVDLNSARRWVAWRSEPSGKAGKPTKVPYSPITGRRAKSNDAQTWGTRAEAETRAKKIVNGLGGGVGIMLGDLGDDFYLGGFDLDSCIGGDGSLAPWAAEIVKTVDSYSEVSPSGRGLKAFFFIGGDDVRWFLDRIGVPADGWGCRRDVPGSDARDHGPAVELYLGVRNFTVTGRRWPGTPNPLLVDRATLDRLASLVPPPKKRGKTTPGGDNSRSAAALRKGVALRREGATFEQMCEGLRTDPETSAWYAEKGIANGGRELQRIWTKAEPPEAPEFSDEQLALEFAHRHAGELRHTATWGKWLVWTGTHWRIDDDLAAFDLARALCRDASSRITDPKSARLARAVASAKTVAAVASLSRSDRKIATQHTAWDADPWTFNSPWEREE